MDIKLKGVKDKWTALRIIKDQLILKHGLVMDDIDEHKPWGAYYRFSLDQKAKFMSLFYQDCNVDVEGDVNPKILVFEPGKKISLQYHERRDEIWRVLYGEVEAYFGEGDKLGEYKTYKTREVFTYAAKFRHKGGASTADWAIVAEIWRHTNPGALSDENDNIRLADDFGRV